MRMAGWGSVSATDEGFESYQIVSTLGVEPSGTHVSMPSLSSAECLRLLAQFFQGTPQVRVPRPIDPDYKPFGCPGLD